MDLMVYNGDIWWKLSASVMVASSHFRVDHFYIVHFHSALSWLGWERMLKILYRHTLSQYVAFKPNEMSHRLSLYTPCSLRPYGSIEIEFVVVNTPASPTSTLDPTELASLCGGRGAEPCVLRGVSWMNICSYEITVKRQFLGVPA